ncbi:MAG: hypothetical protein ABW127_16265 [Candidatus Thiodiazotropha endolucinida]
MAIRSLAGFMNLIGLIEKDDNYSENRLDIPVVNATRIDRGEPCPDL